MVLASFAAGCGDATTADAPAASSEEAPSAPTLDTADAEREVPDVVGSGYRSAKRQVRDEDLEVERVGRYSDSVSAGDVIKQRPKGGKTAAPGDVVTLVVSKGARPEPEPVAEPEPAPEPAEEPQDSGGDCHPSYQGACLDPSASDYDCEGGSGDGPEYVAGPISVVGSDDYDLDRDGDGVACE